ncbi:MAG: hydroxyacid dehydrogenase [Bdellovibrionaceae bacterium]|nr:hydroxyacid dehydrogenase [Pseudobdellovibrionaceae bacterium]
MKISFFDTHHFERPAFERENEKHHFEICFLEPRLTAATASLASGSEVVCSFVNDRVDSQCIQSLKDQGVKLLALRSAGFNHVDIEAANQVGLVVARVPGYSPHAVAEYAIGLLLSLNRKIHKSYLRVKELNFSLDGLVGFDLFGKKVGILGTGKIGSIVAEILAAFGCEVLCFDRTENAKLQAMPNVRYVECDHLCKESDIVSLHMPLTPETHHILSREMISMMKPGVFIINTGRGALIDSVALIQGLKSGQVGGAALDVYEEEEAVFFQDLSDKVLQDDVLARLLTFPNVLVSSHQAFLTQEALANIAATTLENVDVFRKSGGVPEERSVKSKSVIR